MRSSRAVCPGVLSEFVIPGHVTGLIYSEILIFHASSVSISHTANIRGKSELLVHVPVVETAGVVEHGFAFFMGSAR